jgi:hypothetical protein
VAAGDDPRFLNNVETLYDKWYEIEPHRLTTATAQDPFTLAAISTGTLNTTYVPTDAMGEGRNVPVTIRSSATINSGWRWYTENQNIVLFGGSNQSEYVFECRFWIETLASRTVRAGFHDTATSAAPTDGVYFEFNGTNWAGKTMNTGSGSTTATSFVPTIQNWYRLKIETDVDPSNLVTFTIYDETGGGAQVWTDTLALTLPSLVVDGMGAGVIATYGVAAAASIGALAYIGFGTKAAYIRKTQGA